LKKKEKKSLNGVPVTLDFKSNEDFRRERPSVDRDKCIKCGVCYLYCPDSAIRSVDEGYFEADLELCKGCSLCKKQCVTGCISMLPETLPLRHPLF